jgi:[histone H3]-lysine36 N-dimethyltransferase SETMAR
MRISYTLIYFNYIFRKLLLLEMLHLLFLHSFVVFNSFHSYHIITRVNAVDAFRRREFLRSCNINISFSLSFSFSCRRWVAQYTDGNFVVDDKERSGRPSLDINDAIQQQLDVVKYATTRTIAEELGVSHITIGNHLREMGKKYLCNRWIPHHLTEEQMANRERICNELLLKFAANDFLGQLVTMDEIWIYWDNEGSFHHRSWRGEGDTPDVEVRRVLTTRKHLMSVFWDCKGVLLMEVLPRGQTITADVYCQQLDHLVVAIQEKRRRQLQGGYQQFHYLHDNARPHTAGKTRVQR